MGNDIPSTDAWPFRIRWIARIWSMVYFITLALILILEFLNPHGGESFSNRDLVLVAFIPVGAFLGMALAWRWEGVGGAISTLSVLGFYVGMDILDGGLPDAGVLLMLAPLIIPGILFLVSWWLHRQRGSEG